MWVGRVGSVIFRTESVSGILYSDIKWNIPLKLMPDTGRINR